MRVAVNRFQTQDPEDSAFDTNTNAPSSLALSLRLVLSQRRARPITYVSFDAKFAVHPELRTAIPQFQLKGRHFAYLPGNHEARKSTKILVRDLTTGSITPISGQAREKIMGLVLTTDIVAFATFTGMLYTVSLSDMVASLQVTRLPSSSIVTIDADRGYVVCVLKTINEMTAVIYDATSRRSSSFALETSHNDEPDVSVRTVLIDSRAGTIDVVSVGEPGPTSTLRVGVSRYTLLGERTAHTVWERRIFVVERMSVHLGPAHPTGERGLYQMELSIDPYPGSGSMRPGRDGLLGYWSLLFDQLHWSMNVVDLSLDGGSQFAIACKDDYPGDRTRPLLWKDRVYFYSYDGIAQRKVGYHVAACRRGDSFDGPHALNLIGVHYEEESSSLLHDPWEKTRFKWASAQLADVDFSNTDEIPVKAATALGELEDTPVIVAINDTFIIDTYEWERSQQGRLGIACLDERIFVPGSEPTGLW